MMIQTTAIDNLNTLLQEMEAEEVLTYITNKFGNRIALSSSLGAEDQVLTDMLVRVNRKTTIFTLDTGRLFPETYDLIDRTCQKYDIGITIYFPEAREVEKMVNEKGINLFYKSIENRKLCCEIRKIHPLQRAFQGLDAWICGLRKEQSVTRADIQMAEWDEANGLIKINPLIHWTEKEVWDYVEKHNVPVNPLHKKGYPSIGCLPCTRAIFPGEDIRAGRWWWENPDTRECGLHKR
ncbi:MAG: phosphoadenylyl-sulfate reductase [Bacteroidales bacterium]|nr:phosphoadenylyl-sulfate reductase [Bacteroidales bacterium]MDY0284644.1 phosphoadenylyl-sulfate reductase [Bacteroidales bacterium]HPE87433.1 phosphoadenylyl-sulfate reductase [Bacteroidales bacterium]